MSEANRIRIAPSILTADLGRPPDPAAAAVSRGADALAVCYVEIETPAGGSVHGVGLHASIVTASLEAILSAVNRASRSSS